MTAEEILKRAQELKDIAKQYRDRSVEKVIDLTS